MDRDKLSNTNISTGEVSKENSNRYFLGREGRRDAPPTSIKTLQLFLLKDTYSDILYLLLNKKYTYKTELNKLFLKNCSSYIAQLYKNGIIEPYKLTQEELKVLKITKKLNDKNIEQINVYKLRECYKNLLSTEKYYEWLIDDLTGLVDSYLNDLHRQYDENLRLIEEKHKKKKTEEILYMKKMGIEIPLDYKLWYEKILGRKI